MPDAAPPRYSWSPGVIAQVVALPEAGSAAFWAAVEHTDRFSGQLLHPETLVIIIRRLKAAGDQEGVRRTATALVQRWEWWVNDRAWKLFPGSPEDRDDFKNSLYAQLIEELLRPAEVFWEANFIHALTCLASDVARPLRRARRVLTEADLRRDTDREGEPVLDMVDPAPGLDSAVMVQEALALLDGPERTAVYLYIVEGWPIVDNRGGGPSVSRHLGVTDRTVRNYISRGLDKLRAHYTEQGVTR